MAIATARDWIENQKSNRVRKKWDGNHHGRMSFFHRMNTNGIWNFADQWKKRTLPVLGTIGSDNLINASPFRRRTTVSTQGKSTTLGVTCRQRCCHTAQGRHTEGCKGRHGAGICCGCGDRRMPISERQTATIVRGILRRFCTRDRNPKIFAHWLWRHFKLYTIECRFLFAVVGIRNLFRPWDSPEAPRYLVVLQIRQVTIECCHPIGLSFFFHSLYNFPTMSYNPITGIWRSVMLSQLENLDQKMEDRVAV